MGLSIAAIALAVVLVVGLLAWIRRDLRTRGASPRAWWIVVGCYMLAGVAWVVAIVAPLPVALAWLATIPAAVATAVPDRVAAMVGAERPHRARTRPVSAARHVPHAPMARRISGGERRRPAIRPRARLPVDRAASSAPRATTKTAAPPAGAPPPSTIAASPRSLRPASRVPTAGHHRGAPGDLRLAVDLIREAARIPDLDEAARARIEVRLGRLDRFRDRQTDELLDLVREDVEAGLAGEPDPFGADAERGRRIADLLDRLDPRR